MRVINVCEVLSLKRCVSVCALSSLAVGPLLKAGMSWCFPGTRSSHRGVWPGFRKRGLAGGTEVVWG